MTITVGSFGTTQDGREASLYTLTNSKGLRVQITNFGGIILSLDVPDRHGRLQDITLGYDSIEDYQHKGPYFGALIGRYANRLEDSEFVLNGEHYKLFANDGPNHLHGGAIGFDKVLWDAEIAADQNSELLQLSYTSADGEEGYPGELKVTVQYALTEDNALEIRYQAISNKDTVINLTNHAYFNLSGHASGDILNHQVWIDADFFTPVNAAGLPTGEIQAVAGTPMDFTRLTAVGERIDSSHEQIVYGKGYDHNWVLKVNGDKPELIAEVAEPTSGRKLQVLTTKPGVQLYTGNFLDGTNVGKDGTAYQRRSGLCLETQFFPNSMKHKHFPTPILRAGEQYAHTTIYRFTTLD